MSGTSYMARRLVLVATLGILCSVCDVSAQRIVKGLINQCYSVVVLDRIRPVDSLLIHPTLADTIRSGVLIGMVGSCRIVSDTQNAVPLGDLGRMIDVSVVRTSDSITITSPISLDSGWQTMIYQFIVPIESDTVVIDSMVTAPVWDGASGGVVMIRARSAISFRSGTIDVSGLGFAGGARSRDGGDCGLSIPCDVAGSGLSGGKGYSPLLPDSLCRSGHRPWASGGGGGDAHNAGGGGGGNGGPGGRGGNQFRCNPPPGMWGMPGTAMANDSADRVFFGGGGGGGHQNNSVATDGAAGGGIVVLRTKELIGDTIRIRSLGASVTTPARNDGGGGGGAGGTVLIEACSSIRPVRVDVSGGAGGNVDDAHGPGGGGAGGFVIVHPALLQRTAGSVVSILDGGHSGTINGQPTSSNGAVPGDRGRFLAQCHTVKPHTITLDTAAYVGDTVHVGIVSNDTTSLCECDISHAITLHGNSAHALTSGTQLFTRVLLTTQTLPGTIVYSVSVPSQSSFSIPILTTLSTDSVITLTSTSSLNGLPTDNQCTWDGANGRLSIDACGWSLRRIRLDVTSRVSVHKDDTGDLRITIESNSYPRLRLRIFSALADAVYDDNLCGERDESIPPQHEAVINISSWSSGLYFIVVDGPQGSTALPVIL